MVYAFKSYNNNSPYKRDNKQQALESIIKRFSREHTVSYMTYPAEKKSFVDKSVQNLANNSIIEGYFPKENLIRQMAIKRINKILCILISLLITVVVVSYYFVVSCEMKLNEINHQTILLNTENADLQNKLDSLKSFSNVDQTFQKNNMLKKAGQVIEAPEITVDNAENIKKSTKRKIFQHAIGF